jgi:chloride channel 2
MFESIWLIMILIGVLMSILAWCIDELTERLFEIRDDIGKLPNLSSNKRREGLEKWLYERDWTSAFFLWWAWATFFGFASILTVKYLAPQAAGSGIEQVRSIMTGYPIPGYLEINTLVAKVIGLVAVQASGLTVGKEGPFVHIACSLANLLLSLPMFAELKKSRALTKQVISAACATGVSSTFGAPVGGVLFAIEVTSNVYHTSDYWKAFFTAVCGEVVFRELSYFGTARASQISLFPTTFPAQPYLLVELPGYIVLSTVCGLYGGLYVKLILGVRTWRTRVLNNATVFVQNRKQQRQQQASRAHGEVAPSVDGVDEEHGIPDVRERDTNCFNRNWHKLSRFCNDMYLQIAYRLLQPMMYAFCIITITAVLNWFTGQFMKRTLYSAISDFLVSGEMAQDDILNVSADHRLHSTDWGNPSLLFNLIMYFVVKSFLCAIALSLPVPTGTLIPMLAIGLAMGRIGGEIAQMLFGPTFIPGGYALVGASAFIAGSTGAISTAVIIFEITAQLSYMVPVLVAVIVGRAAGKLVSPDYYEALQIMKKLPNIPPLAHQSSYNILAVEIMNPDNIPMLNRFSSLLGIENTLNAPTFRHHDEVHDDDLFAVVDDDCHYLASVARHQLRGVLTSSTTPVTGGENAEKFDLLGIVDTNSIAPSVPITTPAIDCMNMFELTLCSAMFVTDKCRVVGWLDLSTIRHKCESGEL